MSAVPPLLEARGLCKRFGGVQALAGVDLTVHAGEVLALCGENGAGKSTLLKVLEGLYTPDEGTLLLEGRPVVLRTPMEAITRGIAAVHQELELLETLDAGANIFLGREPVRGGVLRLVDERRLYPAADALLRRVGATFDAHTPLATLSLAQRQLVAIARALSIDARVLILDEPTSSLTQGETDRLLGIVDALRRDGVAIVYVSHRLAEVQTIADRVIVLRDGRTVGEMTRATLDADRIVTLMVGRPPVAPVVRPATTPVPRLVVRELRTRRFPQHTMSFAVGAGEVVGVAGLVGSGRTGIALALFGIEPALDGTITIDGEVAVLRTPGDALRYGIALVPEDRRASGLLLAQPVAENVTLPSLARWSRRGLVQHGAQRDAAASLCRTLRVRSDGVEQPAGMLSGGNQQKLVMGKWLPLAPRVVIVDEPTRGVDAGAREELHGALRQLAADGAAVLMISSDLDELLATTDRVLVMRDGRVAGECVPGLMDAASVMRLAVGDAAVPVTGGAQHATT